MILSTLFVFVMGSFMICAGVHVMILIICYAFNPHSEAADIGGPMGYAIFETEEREEERQLRKYADCYGYYRRGANN